MIEDHVCSLRPSPRQMGPLMPHKQPMRAQGWSLSQMAQLVVSPRLLDSGMYASRFSVTCQAWKEV